jgi:cytochrome P450
MTTFFLVMSLHPEIQRQAQAEIERVVGKDRLPTIDDRKDLPYTMALITEVLRWSPVAPMGIYEPLLRLLSHLPSRWHR